MATEAAGAAGAAAAAVTVVVEDRETARFAPEGGIRAESGLDRVRSGTDTVADVTAESSRCGSSS